MIKIRLVFKAFLSRASFRRSTLFFDSLYHSNKYLRALQPLSRGQIDPMAPGEFPN